MKRREFAIVGLSVVFDTALARAQPGGTVYQVGVLDPYVAADDFNDQLRLAFTDTGLIDGRNVRFHWRYADGDITRLPALGAELAGLKVAAIVAIGAPAIRAAQQATAATPVIAGSDDLVGEGLVASLGRTSGMTTGWSILASELNTKRLELLKSTVPAATRIGVLWDPDTGSSPLDALRHVAAELGVDIRI